MAMELKETLCVVKRKEVQERTRLSKSALYQKIKDGTFPTPIKLSKRSVGWISSEITAWLTSQIAESRKEKNVEATNNPAQALNHKKGK